MKNLNKIAAVIFAALLIISISSCEKDNAQDPNVIGGDTKLPQNDVGADYGATLKIAGLDQGLLNSIKDSIIVTKNENGNVTLKTIIIFNQKHYQEIIKFMGLDALTDDAKKVLLDTYKNKFGFKLDTTNPEKITFEYDLKCKMTSEGIQDYVYSKGNESKPFTLIKYSAKVGDKYEFTDSEGKKVVRTVTHIDEKESYQLVFWKIKVMTVEEVTESPLFSKIVYYTNHKFGLVNIELNTKTGKVMNISVVPWQNPNL